MAVSTTAVLDDQRMPDERKNRGRTVREGEMWFNVRISGYAPALAGGARRGARRGRPPMSATDTPFTITITPEMMRESRARFEREIAARTAQQARLQENYRLTRATRLQKLFANVTRFEPSALVHEMAEYERGQRQHASLSLLSRVPVYINVVDTLLRLAIEAAGYRGPQDSGDADAARIHAAQEIQARRQATRARKRAEADQAYRAEAVARELADPRISITHKTMLISP